jgi:beta-glucosidase
MIDHVLHCAVTGILLLICFNKPAWAQAVDACTPQKCAYLNPSLSPEERAKDLVGRMTLEEKVSQSIDEAVAIPRLGIPRYGWWNEALHGVARNGAATVFPQAIGMAATWDVPLLHKTAEAISIEARAKNNEAIRQNDLRRYSGLTYWSPNVNIFRDPRWGRGQETYGEDPFLTSRLGVSFIQGLQGDDPRYLRVVATPKHFAVHSGPESTRHSANVDVSNHDLEDTYLPAFRAAIIEGKAASIMCAYNAIDGAPACANTMLLHQTLRDAWKFNGFVVSDCDAVGDVASGHKYSVDNAHASAVSLQAGTDLDCGKAYQSLPGALKRGLVSQAEIDQALIRLFTGRIQLGMFDPADQVPYRGISLDQNDTPANRALALQSALESIVLLQNRNGILPLKHPEKIAVVGPTAELLQSVEGNYNGTASAYILPLEGLKKQFGDEHVVFSEGAVLAEGLLTPVPSSVLRVSTDGAIGLRAEYFDNPTFSGEPKVVRTDANIDFNWDRLSPAPGLPSTNLSVRWTGVLKVPGPGHYSFAFKGMPRPSHSDGTRLVADPTGEGFNANAGKSAAHGLRVFLDGKVVLDSEDGKPSFNVDIPNGSDHALCVEFVRTGHDRNISFDWAPPAEPLLNAAVSAAKTADVVIAFVGLSRSLEGEEMNVDAAGFRGGDRIEIGLPTVQEQMLKAVKNTGKPLIVVLTSGSAIAANWADKNADAVLEAWYPGEEGGTAIAETLAGISNPSGRLPITFYRDVKDLPPFEDYSMKNRTYRYYQSQPLYPFGYGLSYASFKYSGLTLSKTTLGAGESFSATVGVKNTSEVAGDEVCELYVQAPGGADAKVHPFLAGFVRVHLEPGESKQVTIPVDTRQLSRVDKDGTRSIAQGSYDIAVGGGQPAFSQGVRAKLEVLGSTLLPK